MHKLFCPLILVHKPFCPDNLCSQELKIDLFISTESCISKRSAVSISKIWSLYCEEYRQTFQKSRQCVLCLHFLCTDAACDSGAHLYFSEKPNLVEARTRGILLKTCLSEYFIYSKSLIMLPLVPSVYFEEYR